MKGLFKFLGSGTGRIVRVVLGLVLFAVGLLVLEGIAAWALALVGVVMVFAGIADVCLFAPLAGLPLSGKGIRSTR